MRYTTRLMVALTTAGVLAAVVPAGASAQGSASEQNATSAAPPGTAPALRAPRPKARTDNRIESETGFIVDYPRKDWQQLFGTGSSLLVLFHKDRDVTVAIERTKVANALAPAEITDQTAQLEYEDWAVRRPLATGFGHRFIDYEGERTIVIDFKQPGPRGMERVRIYTMPRGENWFRVVCTTTEAAYQKYADTCHKIALSLTPTR
jgi:hypothetical protein